MTKYVIKLNGKQFGGEFESMTGAILFGFVWLGDTEKDLLTWEVAEIYV